MLSSEWISTQDGVPEEGTSVVGFDGKFCFVVYTEVSHLDGTRGWYSEEDHLPCNITHWTPFPESTK